MPTSQQEKSKRDTLNLRIKPELRGLIDRAAALTDRNRTDFVLSAARRAAEDALLDRTSEIKGKLIFLLVEEALVRDNQRPAGRGIYMQRYLYIDALIAPHALRCSSVRSNPASGISVMSGGTLPRRSHQRRLSFRRNRPHPLIAIPSQQPAETPARLTVMPAMKPAAPRLLEAPAFLKNSLLSPGS